MHEGSLLHKGHYCTKTLLHESKKVEKKNKKTKRLISKKKLPAEGKVWGNRDSKNQKKKKQKNP